MKKSLASAINGLKYWTEGLFRQSRPDWSLNDETALGHVKNRTHYDEVRETSIEGMTIGIFPTDRTEITIEHPYNVPFALGQVWKVTYEAYNGSAYFPRDMYNELEVQQAEDGTLFIGASGDYSAPFTITTNTIWCDEDWIRMEQPRKLCIVGVSGTVTETVVKKIDPKYVPKWDDLKGALFAEETELVTFLEPYTIDMNSSTKQWVPMPFLNTDKIVLGAVLSVVWGGEWYECEVQKNGGTLGIGNAKLFVDAGADTGEPFHIAFNTPSYFVSVENYGTYTCSVVGISTTKKQIDEKYIPDGIARKSDIEAAIGAAIGGSY